MWSESEKRSRADGSQTRWIPEKWIREKWIYNSTGKKTGGARGPHLQKKSFNQTISAVLAISSNC